MSLTLDTNEARKADSVSSSITAAGKYKGVITRAEKLVSKNGVEGFGLSFKSDDGSTANYLDLYTVKPNGEKLRGLGFVQAILACTKTREAQEGSISFDKWDKDSGAIVKATAQGYPVLIGKRIGLLLQEELATNSKTGADVKRVNIFGVFEADSELTASEILDKKTQPEQLAKLVQSLMARPVRDTRTNSATKPANHSGSVTEMDDDIPW
jgi:hypothetical protein